MYSLDNSNKMTKSLTDKIKRIGLASLVSGASLIGSGCATGNFMDSSTAFGIAQQGAYNQGNYRAGNLFGLLTNQAAIEEQHERNLDVAREGRDQIIINNGSGSNDYIEAWVKNGPNLHFYGNIIDKENGFITMIKTDGKPIKIEYKAIVQMIDR